MSSWALVARLFLAWSLELFQKKRRWKKEVTLTLRRREEDGEGGKVEGGRRGEQRVAGTRGEDGGGRNREFASGGFEAE